MFLSADQFANEDTYRELPAGTYRLAYNDSTHLVAKDWYSLLSVEIKRPTWRHIGFDHTHRFFSITPEIDSRCKHTHTRQIRDALALSLTRTGILAPVVHRDLFDHLQFLSNESGI